MRTLSARQANDLSVDESERERVLVYHERTKHHPERYAPGPETLDWDAQPAPFRHFIGSRSIALPRVAEAEAELCRALETGSTAPLPFSLATLGAVLELSLGITAWKAQGPDRWAVRANPSSGNLHPVEGYVLVQGVDGLDSGVYHYCADDHALELRARWPVLKEAPTRVWVALTCVQWREAWKYGERGFRYCELDVGHASHAFEHAAALLGWRLIEQTQLGWDTQQTALGLDRSQDFASGRKPYTEQEEPEVVFELARRDHLERLSPAVLRALSARAEFAGKASLIDAHPMYAWPAIDEITRATCWPDASSDELESGVESSPVPLDTQSAAAFVPARILLGRRSAQAFDAGHVIEQATFARLLQAIRRCSELTQRQPQRAPELDALLFIHRVESLTPGVYVMAPSSGRESWLGARLARSFSLERIRLADGEPELQLLAALPARELARVARTLHCNQAIAANCCFALALMTDFETALQGSGHAYRQLLRRAGRVGHSLYLQAELAGLRGTGIGCFFDDAVAELVQLRTTQVRSLYHFSVGRPLEDPRIETTWRPQLNRSDALAESPAGSK